MAIYILADPHLSFAPGLDKPMDVFGTRWTDHAARLEENWRQMIAGEDTVVIGGDISWGLKLEEAACDLDWISRLPGYKVLVRGNHDLWWKGVTKLNQMYDSIRFLQNDHFFAEGTYICGTRGWLTPDHDDFGEGDEKIYRRELLRLEASLQSARKAGAEGPDILGVLHYPPVSDPSCRSGFQELFEAYGVREVCYGHIHGEDGFRTAVRGEIRGVFYRLVSLDHLNCRPLRIR